MNTSTISENDIYFMREAINEAKKALENSEVPVGCVFVRKLNENATPEIVGRGFNKTNLTKNVKLFLRHLHVFDYSVRILLSTRVLCTQSWLLFTV